MEPVKILPHGIVEEFTKILYWKNKYPMVL